MLSSNAFNPARSGLDNDCDGRGLDGQVTLLKHMTRGGDAAKLRKEGKAWGALG